MIIFIKMHYIYTHTHTHTHIYIYSAFVGLDNKMYTMHGTYVYQNNIWRSGDRASW